MKTKKTPPPSPSLFSSTPLSAYAPSHNQIADRAYEIWISEGCPENRQLEHWLEAERQLAGRNGQLHDPARRLSAESNDPASSDAAEIDAELNRVVAPPVPRSPTSML